MSEFYCKEHSIRSKYSGKWEKRTVRLDHYENQIIIHHPEHKNPKSFSLTGLQLKTGDSGRLLLKGQGSRLYELEVSHSQDLVKALTQHQLNSKIGSSTPENPIMLPKSLNYLGLLTFNPYPEQTKPQKEYPRQKSYTIESDWAINKEDGGLILISQEKKSNQSKILKFVLKRFLETRSFMGISFPVFAMKPESILETYAKSISAAPVLFQCIPEDPVERMKKFVAFIFSFSRLFADMDKPFNPVIGQTYQTKIASGLFSAEQTSHHPPQSSFFFEGEGYTIHSTIELVADISVNSAEGLFLGDIYIDFKDGGQIFGRVLSGQMKGFVVGQNKFRPHGSSYAYDPLNKIICTYKRQTKDFFLGHIGTLKQSSSQKFSKILTKKERFRKFEAFHEKILHRSSPTWKLAGLAIIDFRDPNMLPFLPSQEGLSLLKSDSSFREDIKLRMEGRMQQSQNSKEILQQLERHFRRLRQGVHEKKK